MDESQRIGDAERESAVAALKAHRAAGRLDSTEYEDRSLRARQARTERELDSLFTDLPAPGPRDTPAGMPPVTAMHSPIADGPEQPGPIGAPAVPAPHRSAGLLPEPFAYTVVALAPIAALILFFVTGSWLWFLAIPAVGILMYGPQGGRDGRRRDRRRDR
jgi:hypothetical protein